MKQFLRLGDGYALTLTYDTEKKLLARGPLGISFDTASEILHVSDSVYTPAGPPVSALGAEKSRNCRGEAAEKLAGLSESNQEAYLLNCVVGSNPTFSRGLATYKPLISHVCLGFNMLVIPGKRMGHITDIPAGCAPTITHRPSPTLNTFATFVAVFLALFMCLTAAKQVSAQEAEPADAVMQDINPLQIGDKIPEELWRLPLQVVNHPEGKETITLNDYRGKLIILDFWATWCGSCIKDFPLKSALLDSLKQQSILMPITMEPENVALSVINRVQMETGRQMLSVFHGAAVKCYFPHQFIPHYVVIHPTGTVSAFLSGEHLHLKNVNKILDGIPLSDPMKYDERRGNGTKSLIDMAIDFKGTNVIGYGSVFTERLPGAGYASGNKLFDDLRRFYFYNRPLKQVLEFALDTRLDMAALTEDLELYNKVLDRIICYELVVPADISEGQVRRIMKQDVYRLLREGGQ